MADQAEQDRRKRLLALLLLLLMEETGKQVDALVLAWSVGGIGPDAFVNELLGIVGGAHGQACYVGRQWGGVTEPLNENDAAFADSVVAEQRPFAQGFASDLSAGRYGQPGGTGAAAPKAAQVQHRAAMYVDRVWGTAQEAWAMTLPEDTQINWVLDPHEQHHCEDCPKRADGSPYTPATLPGVPGDGSTACVTACRCHLETTGGEQGPNTEGAA